MGTPHNEAAQGAFAKTVLMPGDPLRAKFIAETFLQDAKLVNNVRGVQGYTGTYQGTPVSVMASGMGMPSIGIYSHELFHFYDVDNIIRVGSAGAISPQLKVRDVVFGQGSCTDSNYAHQFGLGGTFAPIADFTLLETAVAVARRPGGRTTLDCLQRYLNCAEMFLPSTTNWPLVYGLKPGDVERDTEGQVYLRALGKNMAWLLQAVALGRAQIPVEPREKRVYLNLIR